MQFDIIREDFTMSYEESHQAASIGGCLNAGPDETDNLYAWEELFVQQIFI